MSGGLASFGRIASAVSALADLFAPLVQAFRDKQLMKAGQAQNEAAALQGAANEKREADNAREAVRADIIKHPDKLRDDDGFKRTGPRKPGNA